MTRPIVAPPRQALACAEELDDEDSLWTAEWWDAAPSWLVSMIVHTSFFLLMALIAVGGGGGNGSGGVHCEIGGGDGAQGELDGLLAGTLDVPEPVPAIEQAEAKTTSIDAQVLAAAPLAEFVLPPATELTAPKIELASIAGAGKGIGGLGDGRKVGGNGSGDDDEDRPGGFGGPGLNPTRTGVFGLQSEGSTFVYVFDRSGSMNSSVSFSSEGTTVFSITPLQAAKAQLINSLRDLGTRQQFHVLFYNHEVLQLHLGASKARTITATPENKRRAEEFIAAVEAKGQTYHLEPLEIALRLKPEVIFLITDGEEKDEPTDAHLAAIERLNRGRTKINVIQIGFDPRPYSNLVKLAGQNRGKYVFIGISNLALGMTNVQ